MAAQSGQHGSHQQLIQIDPQQTKELGRGSFGVVYEYFFDGRLVAVKKIQLIDYENDREESAMSQLNHPNVLDFIAEQQDRDYKYLVFELCVGTIYDYIQGNYIGQMPSEIGGLIQMASGLQHIHSKQLVHRDIKPANVLISQSFILKISDFGFCKSVTASGSFSVKSGLRGTKNYMAPEYLDLEDKTEEERKQIRANISIDIFSLGCVFFSYLKKSGHLFQDPEKKSTLIIPVNIVSDNKYLKEQIPGDHYAYKVIDGMTQAIPQNRLGLEQVIKDLNQQFTTIIQN